eukprot:gene31425-6600_t
MDLRALQPRLLRRSASSDALVNLPKGRSLSMTASEAARRSVGPTNLLGPLNSRISLPIPSHKVGQGVQGSEETTSSQAGSQEGAQAKGSEETTSSQSGSQEGARAKGSEETTSRQSGSQEGARAKGSEETTSSQAGSQEGAQAKESGKTTSKQAESQQGAQAKGSEETTWEQAGAQQGAQPPPVWEGSLRGSEPSSPRRSLRASQLSSPRGSYRGRQPSLASEISESEMPVPSTQLPGSVGSFVQEAGGRMPMESEPSISKLDTVTEDTSLRCPCPRDSGGTWPLQNANSAELTSVQRSVLEGESLLAPSLLNSIKAGLKKMSNRVLPDRYSQAGGVIDDEAGGEAGPRDPTGEILPHPETAPPQGEATPQANAADDDVDNCPICMDAPGNVCISTCMHTLCLECSMDLIRRHKITPALCPYCRQIIGGFKPAAHAYDA